MTAVNADIWTDGPIEPTVGSLRVVWVEDDLTAVDGDVENLRRSGVNVHVVADLDDAKKTLSRDKADFLLLDQRLPEGTTFKDRGGETFVRQLKAGDHGGLNKDVPFVMITADASWIDQKCLCTLEGFKGIITKESAVTTRLKRLLETEFSVGFRPDPPDRRRTIATLVRRMRVRDHDAMSLRISSWEGDGEAVILYSALPDEVQQEVDSFGLPLEVSCTYNTDAAEARDLDIRSIERTPQVDIGDSLDSLGDS